MLVGRTVEIDTLKNFYNSKQAEFLAIYGRRRVGKTYLIKNFFDGTKCKFLHVTGLKDGDLSEQLSRFVKGISDTFFNGIELKMQERWIDAFDSLVDIINKNLGKKQKIVIFLDELPWMATRKSKLLQALDYTWNHTWSHDPRIKLVICGSSASWIINKVINNKGGLHNRVTCKILLRPFNLLDTKKFLSMNGVNLTNWQVVQIYMVTGGIPFYLSFVKKGQSSAQIIERLAFAVDGPLLKEFDNLFASLFEDGDAYIELVKIIAKNRYGVAHHDIIRQLKNGTSGGRISTKLNELEEAGFITEFVPYQHTKRGIYYKVTDEYSLFYLYWIKSVKKKIQKNNLESGYWQTIQNSPSWYSWSGLAFEALVYKHISQVRKKLEIPVTALVDSWRYVPKKGSIENGAQIDLLFDRTDDVITICEIKYTDKSFVIDKEYSKKIINKRDVFVKQTGTKKDIFISMIAANGIKDNPYSDALVTGVVTLDDLFG